MATRKQIAISSTRCIEPGMHQMPASVAHSRSVDDTIGLARAQKPSRQSYPGAVIRHPGSEGGHAIV